MIQAQTRILEPGWHVAVAHQEVTRPPGPSQIQAGEVRLLTWLAEHVYTGAGALVDAGCGSGGSSHALCVGLSRNARIDRREGRLHSFDRFTYDHPSYKTFLVPGLGEPISGGSFVHHFFANIGTFHPLCLVHAGDLLHQIWDDTPVELLFVDVAKTGALMRRLVEMFFSCLIPGRSVIVHQDFERPNLHWIHTSVGFLLDECPVAGPPVDCSLVLEVQRPIPPQKIARLLADDFTLKERLMLLDRLVEAVPKPPAGWYDPIENARLTRAYLHTHHGDHEAAQRIATECRQRSYFATHTDYGWMLNTVAATP